MRASRARRTLRLEHSSFDPQLRRRITLDRETSIADWLPTSIGCSSISLAEAGESCIEAESNIRLPRKLSPEHGACLETAGAPTCTPDTCSLQPCLATSSPFRESAKPLL